MGWDLRSPCRSSRIVSVLVSDLDEVTWLWFVFGADSCFTVAASWARGPGSVPSSSAPRCGLALGPS